MKRRTALYLPKVAFTLLVLLWGSYLVFAQQKGEDLYRGFLDPPRKYSPEPFWFWNGKMEGAKVQEQIRRMVEQHVYGAFLHGRDGLETPYLSEDWWKAIGAGLEEAKRVGFSFDFVDDYDWPSGEIRNAWRTDNHQSEVIAGNPNFRQRTLAHKEEVIKGPRDVSLAMPAQLQAVVIARWLGNDRIDGGSLQDITAKVEGGQLRWSAPEGDWVIVSFFLEPAMGLDGGYVDLLNPEAMKLFIDLSYGEFYRRFGSYFGDTIHYSFADHEGDDGYRIAWTPSLFEEFAKRKGYDLRKVLPLLFLEGGDQTTKVRCDYLETVTRIYDASFWTGITSWAKAHRIGRTGHGWEDWLQWAAALHGDLFTIERGLNPVGVDSLFDFGRQPGAFKVAQSVADFEGRRFMCENQGVQGTDSYLDMEGMRRGTNGIGAWGVDLFVPHAVNYDASKANYPPDWLHQPYWPYFHYYADYVRRISYMNGESRHVTNLLLYYPITSVWAHADPVFSNKVNYYEIMNPKVWNSTANLVNDYYSRLILELTARHWDHNIADDYYLDKARIEGKELVIGSQRFSAVVLPPLTTLRRATLKKLLDFYQAGGTILGIRSLPDSSPEAGGNDAELNAGIAKLFGAEAGRTPRVDAGQQNAKGGRAYFIAAEVGKLVDMLDAQLPKDVQVVEGSDSSLICQHRERQGEHFYWMVNDTDRPRTNRIVFSQPGIPEKWDPLTGQRSPLFYVDRGEGTEVRLTFGPWDAYYVVFKPRGSARQEAELVSNNAENFEVVSRDAQAVRVHVLSPATGREIQVTLREGERTYKGQIATGNLQPIRLDGDWDFRPQPERVSVTYAKVKDTLKDNAERFGWAGADFDDTAWPSLWLSEAQNTIRNWNVIGPFPNEDDAGFTQVFPPEKALELDQRHAGLNGELVGWTRYYGDTPQLDLRDWGIWMEPVGGPFDDAAHIVQFNRVLPAAGKNWVVSYALCYLYSPLAQKAQFIVAADNSARIWLNQKLVFERLRHPFWYELTDNWADRIPVELQAGWNTALVKVGVGRSVASGYYGFTFRVADANGRTLPDVVNSLVPDEVALKGAEDKTLRWYRLEVPPGCVAVVPPALRKPYRFFLNGQELKPAGAQPIDIRKLLVRQRNVLVIGAFQYDKLSTPVEFVTGLTPFALKPWTKTGLVNFSGTAIYEKNLTIPETYRGKRLILDCGRVSSVAEVYVNGQKAGTAVWRPFRVDITKLVKPGRNRLRILVTNTEANQRAVGTYHRILKNIDVDGLEGPVEVVPYVDAILTCRPHPAK